MQRNSKALVICFFWRKIHKLQFLHQWPYLSKQSMQITLYVSITYYRLFQVVSLQYLSLFQGSQLSCTLIGSIFRHSHERVVSVMTDLSQTFLGCLVSVKFLLESSLCSRYWVFEGERRNFEDAHACSPFIAHSITTDQMLMLTEINMNFLYLPKFLEALISFIMWLQQYMHHDWLLKKISYNDLDLLASVCVQGRYNLCL